MKKKIQYKAPEPQKKYPPIPKFVEDTHKNCKGHGNFMLDSTLETEADRRAVILAVDSAIASLNAE